MPGTALTLYLALFVAGVGWRSWLQRRRTGDDGIRGFSGRAGSIEWLGGFLPTAGTALAGAAASLQMSNVISPIASLDQPWLHRAGLASMVLGFIITIAAQLNMRNSWRIGVKSDERTELVTEGLFQLSRNPIYVGMILATLGLALMAPTALAFAGLAILLIGLEIQVRKVEEPYLRGLHGERYRVYAGSVGRFVPGIGRTRK
jgi:protein-S-isoprenylcysteine O-methyltransferase Ste14